MERLFTTTSYEGGGGRASKASCSFEGVTTCCRTGCPSSPGIEKPCSLSFVSLAPFSLPSVQVRPSAFPASVPAVRTVEREVLGGSDESRASRSTCMLEVGRSVSSRSVWSAVELEAS